MHCARAEDVRLARADEEWRELLREACGARRVPLCAAARRAELGEQPMDDRVLPVEGVLLGNERIGRDQRWSRPRAARRAAMGATSAAA